MTINKKPIVGVIPDFDNGSKNSYSSKPHYAVRQNYLDILIDSGATPIILPYDYQSIDQYLNMIDGLMVIGGFFDINPEKYGENILNDTVKLNNIRGNFEFEFVKNFLATKLPILGICNGMQVINVVRGGNLIQDIESEEENYIIHEQSKIKGMEDCEKPYHEINIKDDSLLYEICQKTIISANSSHHQAIRNTGENLTINCFSPDGIIEGIEDKSHPFCLGVQWHPEYRSCDIDIKIVQAFVKSCNQ